MATGAFSHSRSQVDTVVNYVLKQDEHHRKTPFKDEYLEKLRKNDVKYAERYLFDFYEDGNIWEDK